MPPKKTVPITKTTAKAGQKPPARPGPKLSGTVGAKRGASGPSKPGAAKSGLAAKKGAVSPTKGKAKTKTDIGKVGCCRIFWWFPWQLVNHQY